MYINFYCKPVLVNFFLADKISTTNITHTTLLDAQQVAR